MEIKKIFSSIIICLIGLGCYAQSALQEWQDSKFSMFIHWGLYSKLGGVWKDKPVTYGLSEQIQAHAGIYSDVYAREALSFNPEAWNADSIVKLAQRAGMRSIVFTSKHHDGFCMFRTATTDFNIVDATPYKRDVLKELSEACKRHGMRLGLYFSLIDWHYPEASPISSHNSDAITPKHFEYNKEQIKELLTNYGPITELWFDMGSHSLEQSKEMKALVKSLQPDCMVGSRLGNDMNDFMVMGDNQEPNYIIGVPWQSPASFFSETWGYRSWQKRTDSHDKYLEKLHSLIRVTARGGNYLLNIGPMGDGSVVPYEQEILERIGKWLKIHAEAIYATQSDPFYVAFDWGQISSNANRTKLYLHILEKPSDNTIFLPGLQGKYLDAKIMRNGSKCQVVAQNGGISIQVPKTIDPKKDVEVIALSFKGEYKTLPANIVECSPTLQLNSHNAFKYYSNSGVDYNTRYKSTIKEMWTLQASQDISYAATLSYCDEELGRDINLQVGDKTQVIKLQAEPQTLPDIKLKWGDIYTCGPNAENIDYHPELLYPINTQLPWGEDSLSWEKSSWKNNVDYPVECWLHQATYMLQTITADKDGEYVIKVKAPDAVKIWLNGEELITRNNPYKEAFMEQTVLLRLKKGENQLLVKTFTNFLKQANVGIYTNVPQRKYVQTIEPIRVSKNRYLPISWQLHEPMSPHQTLDLPALNLELHKQ